MIRTIPDGQTITEPGLYRVSMEHYHSQSICPGPSVSSTGIRLALQSPMAFWGQSEMNPNRVVEDGPESPFLILGKAAHCLILGDEVFADHFVLRPDHFPDYKTKAAQDWRDGVFASGKAPLTKEQVKRVGYMAENLAASPEAKAALTGGLTEVSMIWQDELTGIWIKSRPDCIPTYSVDLGDLKGFSPQSSDLGLAAEKATTQRRYNVQMAMACEGIKILTDRVANQCVLVFSQFTKPYEVVPLFLELDALYWGKVMFRQGLERIAHGLKTGEWPGWSRGYHRYTIPPRDVERFELMQQMGDMPQMER